MNEITLVKFFEVYKELFNQSSLLTSKRQGLDTL